MKKPPFAHKVAAALSAGELAKLAFSSPNGRHISPVVACGSTAWSIGHALDAKRCLYLVCPPTDRPDIFDWRVMAGHDPILLFSEDGEHDALAAALIRDGVKRVVCCRTGRRWVAGGGA
jgi:hypothetical protein